MKQLLGGIIVGIALVAASVLLYFCYGFAPVATADPPMPMERYLAKQAQRARIREEMPHRDVSSFTTTDLVAGARVYKDDCAFCHGLIGQPSSDASRGMYPDPPQFFAAATPAMDDPVGEAYWKVENGLRLTGMPSFRSSLTDQQIWDVSALLARAKGLSPAVLSVLSANSPGASGR